jgi:RNA polymerase sigma-70 factor (ECF subfamily)
VLGSGGPAAIAIGPPAAPADEAAEVARARLDPAAFAPLYHRYALPVFRYCHRLLGNHEAAEDATSLVFANALAALPRYRHERDGAFRTWLFVIAHNAIANSARDARARCPVELDEALPDRRPTPEEVAVTADEHRSLRAMLAQLPPDQRRVAELRLAGLTGEEIAQTIGRSHPAVRMLQLRAVARLRELMGGDTAGEGRSHG